MSLIIKGEIWKTKDGKEKFLILAESSFANEDELIPCFNIHKCNTVLLERKYLLSEMKYHRCIASFLVESLIQDLKRLNKRRENFY